ncbi:hypothetical protein SMAC4_13818 [Sordaria macrospora]|uniref:uncharacterized protein n=1 Tax=Sordaria macrospora TaxID=5147 RepID=UPI002B2D9FB8|nr:hypothetical protein SMAC4_13818 [Sordaria macrospora]
MDETPPTNLADLANVTRGPRRTRQRLRFEPQQTPQRTTRASQAAAQEEARRAALRSVGSGFTPEPRPSSTSPPVNQREQSSTMPRKFIYLHQILSSAVIRPLVTGVLLFVYFESLGVHSPFWSPTSLHLLAGQSLHYHLHDFTVARDGFSRPENQTFMSGCLSSFGTAFKFFRSPMLSSHLSCYWLCD